MKCTDMTIVTADPIRVRVFMNLEKVIGDEAALSNAVSRPAPAEQHQSAPAAIKRSTLSHVISEVESSRRNTPSIRERHGAYREPG